MTRKIIGREVNLDGKHLYREISADEMLMIQKDLITAGEVIERLFNYMPDEYLTQLHQATDTLLEIEEWAHRSITPIEWQKAVRNDKEKILFRSLMQLDLPF